MKERTKDFALRVVRLHASLPNSVIAQTPGRQVEGLIEVKAA